MSKRKVAYYYDPEIGNFYYGQGHPMKPHRVRMAHSLVLRYGLYNQLDIFRPHPAGEEVLKRFHSSDYIDFLKNVTPTNQTQDAFASQIKQYSIASDCPIFDRMYQYCQLYTGGSVGGAVRLNHGLSDVVVNWSGGLHHAKKAEASGFCYVNDIVISILELLKYHTRVLYIDIDVHHGDGVEEAFLTTDRVLTVSFHKHGDGFFPGTGGLEDCGSGPGHYYAVNVPLQDGIDDESYGSLFAPIMTKIMERYQPGAIVLQSGADSIAGDRLGVFNLSIKGHGACHRLMKSFGVPLLVLGGGGYKIKNVARCWTYETAVLMGVEEQLEDFLPPNEYYEYFAPDYRLHVPLDRDMVNQNKKEHLDKLRTTVLQNLDHIHAVSVGFHERAPDAPEAAGEPAGPGMDEREDMDEDRGGGGGWQGRRDNGDAAGPSGGGAVAAWAVAGAEAGPSRSRGVGGDEMELEDGAPGGGGGRRAGGGGGLAGAGASGAAGERGSAAGGLAASPLADRVLGEAGVPQEEMDGRTLNGSAVGALMGL